MAVPGCNGAVYAAVMIEVLHQLFLLKSTQEVERLAKVCSSRLEALIRALVQEL